MVLTKRGSLLSRVGPVLDTGETPIQLCTKSPNPTHGSGWMLQILPTMSHVYEGLKSHQRELVDGSDRFYTESVFALEILNCTYLDI
jgi:hypothetical protein